MKGSENMANLTNHERPGIYSGYEMASVLQSGSGGKAVAIATLVSGADAGLAGEVVTLHKAEGFSSESVMGQMVALALANGAYCVYAYGVKDAGGYAAAYEALLGCDNVGVLVSDASGESGLQLVREAVVAASNDRRECVGVCGVCGAVSEQIALAQVVNSERMVLVGTTAAAGEGLFAAAVGGAVAALGDVSVPLGGAELNGALPECGVFSDNEIDALVRGGVTAVESRRGVVEVVRAVTSRSKSGNGSDSTWRELTTVLIVDNVVSGLRESLKARFHRARNTEQMRGAIRSQVILELENKKSREMIAGYQAVSVQAMEENPTVCLVTFAFSVSHGLNQIWISAHISV